MQSERSTVRRIGLFGGTFDPVHFGHLRPALELVEQFDLSSLHLVPNHRPMHRESPTASTEQRIAMLNLATADSDVLHIDCREAQRDKASYTVDTLTEVRAENPDASLVFFMGVDAFDAFHTWRHWSRILELANLVVIDRPDATLGAQAQAILVESQRVAGNNIREAHHGAIERTSVTQLAISATKIRRCVASGLSIRYLLPESVRGYIGEHNLYCRL